jgi:hypothetical protein
MFQRVASKKVFNSPRISVAEPLMKKRDYLGRTDFAVLAQHIVEVNELASFRARGQVNSAGIM